MDEDFVVCNRKCALMAGALLLAGLYLTSLYSYLLFHSLAEFFSIVVAWSVFVLAWNSRRFITNHYLLFLGVAYLFVGGLDLLHTLAYKGMGVFPGEDTGNLATQLWIAARYLEAGSLLAAPLFLKRRLNLGVLVGVYAAIVTALLVSIFAWPVFPACFVEGSGLTTFKKASEYVISGILVAAIVLLLRNRKAFDAHVLRLVIASIVLTIASELAFTFYVSVYGLSNLVGHYLKIISFYLIYRALVETGLRRPYSLLFRSLKESEAAMRALSSRYEAILAAAPDIIVEVDADRKIIWMNLAGVEFFGSDALGKKASSFFVGEQDTYEKVQPLFEGDESVFYVESRQRRRDGAERLLAWWCRVIKDAAGNVMGALATARDITDQQCAEDERRQLEAQMQRAERLESLGALAGGIAHDFNNLLTVVIGNADLAMGDLPQTSPVRRDLEAVKTAGLRASELSNQMLAYSGKGRFVVEPLDLNALLRDMADQLRASVSPGVALRLEPADGAPLIEGDARQLRQVVLSLVGNASEAIGEEGGAVTVRVDVVALNGTEGSRPDVGEQLPRGHYVALDVCDTGCGMDENTKEKMFDPFFSTKFPGRGLGLAAVLGIVCGHRGAIRVESEVGQGTTLRVLLPCAGETAAATIPAAADARDDWRGTGTVLVIDDETGVRNLAEAVLGRLGFAVLAGTDGQEGIVLFQKHADDIVAVLLDLTMPGMNGAEVFAELRRIRNDVKVILCSGYSEQTAMDRFPTTAPAGFLKKPFEISQLRAKLREVLESQAPSRP